MFQSVLTVRMFSPRDGHHSSASDTSSQQVAEAPALCQEAARSSAMSQVRLCSLSAINIKLNDYTNLGVTH